jgi:hypothetical protein
MAACHSPCARGNAVVAWSPPATSHQLGQPPATSAPRDAHAAIAPCALISRCRGPKEKHPLYLDSSSRQLTVLLPCRLLLSSTVRTSPAPAPYAPPPASSSPFSLTSATPTPHRRTPPPDRHRRREPTTESLPPPYTPNRDPRRPGLLSGRFPTDQRLPAGRIRPVSHRRQGKFSPPLFLRSRAEMPKGTGPLGQAGLVVLWAEPKCTVTFFI